MIVVLELAGGWSSGIGSHVMRSPVPRLSRDLVSVTLAVSACSQLRYQDVIVRMYPTR